MQSTSARQTVTPNRRSKRKLEVDAECPSPNLENRRMRMNIPPLKNGPTAASTDNGFMCDPNQSLFGATPLPNLGPSTTITPRKWSQIKDIVDSPTKSDFVLVPNRGPYQFSEVETVVPFEPASYLPTHVSTSMQPKPNMTSSGLVFCDITKLLKMDFSKPTATTTLQQPIPATTPTVKQSKFHFVPKPQPPLDMNQPIPSPCEVDGKQEEIVISDDDDNDVKKDSEESEDSDDWVPPNITSVTTNGVHVIDVNDSSIGSNDSKDNQCSSVEMISVVSDFDSDDDGNKSSVSSSTLTPSNSVIFLLSSSPTPATGLCDTCGCIIGNDTPTDGNETISDHVCGECLCSLCGNVFLNKDLLKKHVEECIVPSPPSRSLSPVSPSAVPLVDADVVATISEVNEEQDEIESDSDPDYSPSDQESDSSSGTSTLCDEIVSCSSFRTSTLSPAAAKKKPSRAQLKKKSNKIKSHSKQQNQSTRSNPEIYTCDICLKTFTQEYGQVNHLISIHCSIESYDCDRCRDSFKRPMELHRHIIKSHRSVHEPKFRKVGPYW